MLRNLNSNFRFQIRPVTGRDFPAIPTPLGIFFLSGTKILLIGARNFQNMFELLLEFYRNLICCYLDVVIAINNYDGAMNAKFWARILRLMLLVVFPPVLILFSTSVHGFSYHFI
jgi:hypothetical protein